MFEFLKELFGYLIKTMAETSVGELQFMSFVEMLFSCALFVLLVLFIIKVPLYLKRIAIALEQKNLILSNNKDNNYSSNQPRNIVEERMNPSEIIGPNTPPPPVQKKNVFTTDLGDLFKK